MQSNKTTTTLITFFERSPFMSVELLDILDNYQIVCYENDYLYNLIKENWSIVSYQNTTLVDGMGNDDAIKIMLKDSEFMSKISKSNIPKKILFFYMDQEMDRLLKINNIPMVLPSYDIQEKLGDKLSIETVCKYLKIKPNRGLVFRDSSAKPALMFEECKTLIALPFIIQGSFGVSGEDTFLVSNLQEFNQLINKINGGYKATRFLKNNIPLSVHINVLEEESIIHGPYLQLVGLPELSRERFHFSGNDTNQSLFSNEIIQKIREISERIATYAGKLNYRGICGVDFLWDRETNEIYLQEINSRLAGLTRLLTGIQKDQKLIPDLLKHIEHFDNSCIRKNLEDFKTAPINLHKHDYAQVYICNNLNRKVKVNRYLTPGIYKIKDPSRGYKESLFVHDMNEDEFLVTYCSYTRRSLEPGDIIVKIILKRSIIKSGEYQIEEWFTKLNSTIKGYILH